MDPFSLPPSVPLSVVIPDAPPKRHVGRWIAILVVVAAAIGGTAFALTRSDDKPKYSLNATNDATEGATSMSFALTMDVFGTEITGDFEIDIEHGLTHVTMDLGSSAVGLGGKLEMIVDMPNHTTYVSRDFFESIGVPIDTDWVRMDSEFLDESGDGSVFDASATGDPLDATAAIGEALKTEDLGFAKVDGIKVKRYRVTFRGEDVFAFNPQFTAILEEAGTDVPDEVVYEFYVDEQNVVRRISYQVDLGTSELTGDMIVKSINEPVNIKIPDEADVTDARDLM